MAASCESIAIVQDYELEQRFLNFGPRIQGVSETTETGPRKGIIHGCDDVIVNVTI